MDSCLVAVVFNLPWCDLSSDNSGINRWENELGCMHARCPTWICASWILLDTSQCGHCRPHATVWCLHCSAIEWFHCTIGALRAVVVLHKGIFLHDLSSRPMPTLRINNREYTGDLSKNYVNIFFYIQKSGLFNVSNSPFCIDSCTSGKS